MMGQVILVVSLANKALRGDSRHLVFSVQGWALCLWCNNLGSVVALFTEVVGKTA